MVETIHSSNDTLQKMPMHKEGIIDQSCISGMSVRTKLQLEPANRARANHTQKDKLSITRIVEPHITSHEMSHRPIIQKPDDADTPHPTIEQPNSIDPNELNAAFSIEKHHNRDLLDLSIRRLNRLLKNEKKRHAYEYSSFETKTIEEENILFIPTAERARNSTIGIRGAVAKCDLPAGSPLIYSAQYLTEVQWFNNICMLAVYLHEQLDLSIEKAVRDAQHRLTSYAGRPKEFQSAILYTPAYGAGNVAAMVNHDVNFFNMTAIHVPTLDKNNNKTAGIWLYFTLKDISRGEQLLINYGKNYDFTPAKTARHSV